MCLLGRPLHPICFTKDVGPSGRLKKNWLEVTFAGNWPTNARPVMEKAGHGYVLFFLLCLSFDFDLLMDQSETF